MKISIQDSSSTDPPESASSAAGVGDDGEFLILGEGPTRKDAPPSKDPGVPLDIDKLLREAGNSKSTSPATSGKVKFSTARPPPPGSGDKDTEGSGMLGCLMVILSLIGIFVGMLGGGGGSAGTSPPVPPVPPPIRYAVFVQQGDPSQRLHQTAYFFALDLLEVVTVPPGKIPFAHQMFAKRLDYQSFGPDVEETGLGRDIYIIEGDSNLEVADLVGEESLKTRLKSIEGEVTDLRFQFVGDPRGPPSPHRKKIIYVVGDVKKVNLPDQYGASAAHIDIIDLRLSEERIREYGKAWSRYEVRLETYKRAREIVRKTAREVEMQRSRTGAHH